MTTLTVCVGLDYHADSIRVCVMTMEGEELTNRSVRNEVARSSRPFRTASLNCMWSCTWWPSRPVAARRFRREFVRGYRVDRPTRPCRSGAAA